MISFCSAMFLAVTLSSNAPEPARSRTFRLTYEATVTALEPDQIARIWLPVPSNSNEQIIELLEFDLPGISKFGREAKFGNRILYVEAKADNSGTVPLRITYRIARHEVRGPSGMATQAERDLFLQPYRFVPAKGKYLSLIEGKKLPEDPTELVRALYDIVNSELRYSKEGLGWGQGDVNWVCDSKYGNCTDFHSLFIGLARAHNIPCKFEIGFPLPEKRGSGDIAGYHCWAKFRSPSNGWVPVDISMANQNQTLKDYFFGNLTEDRVTFSVGRDVDLVPKQDSPPLNYFIFPHVEVNGKIYPADKIKRKITFTDVDAK